MSYKKSKMSFPFYVDDYLAETSRFNVQQHGMYLLLLLEYWREGGPLKNEKSELCEITMIDQKSFEKLMPSILKKFEVDGEILRHASMDIELSKYNELQKKRRKGGRLSAEKRWGKPAKKSDNPDEPDSQLMSGTR